MAVALVPGQTAVGTTGTTQTASLTLTLPAATTKGNCLVVCAVLWGSTFPTLSSITCGSDTLASQVTLSAGANSYLYALSNLAGGSSSISITGTGGVSPGVMGYAFEFSGVLTVGAILDQSSTHTSAAGTSFTSNFTPTTTQANEAWVGFGSASKSAAITATGPASPWANLTAQTAQPGSGTTRLCSVAGYQAGNLGTNIVTYSGTLSATSTSNPDALVATFLPATPPPPRLFLSQAVKRAAFY